MGEVFRAHDTRLGRDVALKVLSGASGADPASRGRFDREARLLASLNHPAIAQIFGIESHGDAPVIVMEVVEGATLAERLAKGPLAIGEALAMALQICDGLEAAHERGVLHRDLKPSNIKVRPDGTVKILDFGLARALAPDTAAADATKMSGGSTETGIVMGTPSYMSPEQAKGHTLDRRADIWAFGCVLFEMLAGTRAFPGDSSAEILANVVHEDPDWPRLPADTPPRIVELLRRCLQKNLKERLRDIGDARYEIARAMQAPGDSREGGLIAARRSPMQTAGWFAAGAAAAAAILLGVQALRAGGETPAVPYRAAVTLPANTSLALSRGSAVALSPDGSLLAYAGRSGNKTLLYLRRLDEFEAQAVPGTEDAQNPFFSPDGHWIGFFTADKLKRVAIDGGAPMTIADVVNPRGEAWGTGDHIVLTPSNNVAMSRVSVTGGKAEPLTTLSTGERSHRWPRFLPGGSMLFSIWNDLGWEPARIAVRGPDGTHKVVVEGGGYPRYVDGYLVYARAEGLMAARFDERAGTISGQPAPIVDGVITNFSGGAHFDVSANGTLAYVPGGSLEAARRLVWVSLDDQTVTPALDARQGMGLVWRLSHDGRRVVRNNTFGRTRDNWLEDLSGRTSTRLESPSDGFVSNPIFSPDASWIAYSLDTPVLNIFRQSTAPGALAERLTNSPHMQAPSDVSPDGRHLLYIEFDPVSGADIWVLTLPAAGPGASAVDPASLSPRVFVKTDAIENYPALSRDGKWVAYQSNESGRFEIFVRSFPGGDRTFRVSVDGGVSPKWSADGTAILFRDAASQMRSALLSEAVSGRPPQARVLFDARQYENVYGVAPDGKRLLMMPVVDAERAPNTINVVFNFLSELKRRVR